MHLQGHNFSIIDLYGKVKSIQINLILWISELNMKMIFVVQILPMAWQNESGSPLKECLLTETEDHLLSWTAELLRYFPNVPNEMFPLTKTPLSFQPDDIPGVTNSKYIEVINNTGVKIVFSTP
jgi:hypothetical protein